MPRRKLPKGFEPHPVDEPTFAEGEAEEWKRCTNCGSQTTHTNRKGLCPFCAAN